MKTRWIRGSVAVAAGLLFAVGLTVGGMTSPANVIGFLDLGGAWRPALAFVMLGGVLVSAAAYAFARRRQAPIAADRFCMPARQTLDARLLGGAALFGVGWGLGGYCPGPGVVALASGAVEAGVFVLAMLFGMTLFNAVQRTSRRLGA